MTAGGSSPGTTADFSILNNHLEGNFTFEHKTTNGANPRQVVTRRDQYLNVDFGTFVGLHNASAAFAIDGSGLAGSTTGALALAIPDISTAANTTFSLAINTSGSPVNESVNVGGTDQTIDVPGGSSYVKIELSGELDVGPAGSAQPLMGTFDFEDSSGNVTVGFSGVSATLGGVVSVSGASGILNVTTDGVGGSADIDSLQLPQNANATVSGSYQLKLTVQNGQTDVTVKGTGVSLLVFGQSLDGNFTFSKNATGATIDFDTVDVKFGGGVVGRKTPPAILT